MKNIKNYYKDYNVVKIKEGLIALLSLAHYYANTIMPFNAAYVARDTLAIACVYFIGKVILTALTQELNIFADVHHSSARMNKVHTYSFVAYGNYMRAVGYKTFFAYGCGARIKLNRAFGNSVDNFFHFYIPLFDFLCK